MRKRTTALALAAAMALPATAAVADQPEDIAAKADCTLANGTNYATPGAMLKALTERDGHFQETVAKYNQFETVADLVHQKCNVGN